MTGDAPDPRRSRAELVATVILSIATVLTAWSAFQATKWGGEMSLQFSAANAARTFSVAASNTANAQTTIDVALFAEYAAAVAMDDGELAAFFETRFRDEFRPAFTAWVATDPLTSPGAPASPFEMDEYVLAATVEANELAADAEAASALAREANQRGDNYVLLTVLFASVLFFAGVSSKAGSLRIQQTLTVLSGVLLLTAAGIVLTFPVLL